MSMRHRGASGNLKKWAQHDAMRRRLNSGTTSSSWVERRAEISRIRLERHSTRCPELVYRKSLRPKIWQKISKPDVAGSTQVARSKNLTVIHVASSVTSFPQKMRPEARVNFYSSQYY